jgi:hypothetical protein
MGIWGQDWASYQSAAPATAGLSFAFVKVTEGLGYVNPRWVAQRDHAKAAGLVWGGYHYPHMANSVQAEADKFLSEVNWAPGDLVCLDWEGYDPANAGVPRSEQAAYKDAWLKYVKARLPHNPVGMYCNTDYWRNVDTTGFYGDFLWIATSGLPAGSPGIAAPWLFHQYGASGVDRDYCHLASTAALRSWALSFQPSPEVDMTPAESQQLADLHKALVDRSIPSLIDGAAHSIGEHVQATNDWAWITRAEVTALKSEVDALKASAATVEADVASLKAQMMGAVTGLGTTLAAIAKKLGA